MEFNLAVLPDDGVGPAVTTRALNVLQAVSERFDHSFNFNEGLVGGVAIDTPGRALSHEILYTVIDYANAELQGRIVWNSP